MKVTFEKMERIDAEGSGEQIVSDAAGNMIGRIEKEVADVGGAVRDFVAVAYSFESYDERFDAMDRTTVFVAGVEAGWCVSRRTALWNSGNARTAHTTLKNMIREFAAKLDC